jgi:hypothetical protein
VARQPRGASRIPRRPPGIEGALVSDAPVSKAHWCPKRYPETHGGRFGYRPNSATGPTGRHRPAAPKPPRYRYAGHAARRRKKTPVSALQRGGRPARGSINAGRGFRWWKPLPGVVGVRRCPTLPPSFAGSTIGAGGLSFRVRNGSGRFPFAVAAVTRVKKQTRTPTI